MKQTNRQTDWQTRKRICAYLCVNERSRSGEREQLIPPQNIAVMEMFFAKTYFVHRKPRWQAKVCKRHKIHKRILWTERVRERERERASERFHWVRTHISHAMDMMALAKGAQCFVQYVHIFFFCIICTVCLYTSNLFLANRFCIENEGLQQNSTVIFIRLYFSFTSCSSLLRFYFTCFFFLFF